MNQETTTTTQIMCSSYFQSVDVESSSESFDEMNSTIFREMDCDNDASGSSSRPSVLRANPISESGFRVISPYPYSPTEEELEERSNLTDLRRTWEMEEAEDEEGIIDAIQPINVESFSELRPTKSASMYSFYFETIPMEEANQECDDDFTISTRGSDSFQDDEFCLENISEDPISFWENGITPPVKERAGSPTQISIGSENEDQSQRVGAMVGSTVPSI